MGWSRLGHGLVMVRIWGGGCTEAETTGCSSMEMEILDITSGCFEHLNLFLAFQVDMHTGVHNT